MSAMAGRDTVEGSSHTTAMTRPEAFACSSTGLADISEKTLRAVPAEAKKMKLN